MITETAVFVSDKTDPYYNQAVEKYLLDTCKDHQMILYLWQNRDTVFVGKNQNAFNECAVQQLRKDGGFLARRISGGGAVFHDLGNLNFTFICCKDEYDSSRQDQVILCGLKKLGIDAVKNGRNDLEIAGRKFSGHAYYKGRRTALHHGTIMLEVDEQKLQKYLHVSLVKLHAKNVDSVRSRVINLKQIDPGLSVDRLKEALLMSFADGYGKDPAVLQGKDFDETLLKQLEAHFADHGWQEGQIKKYPSAIEKRMAWGTIRIEYELDGSLIKDAAIYTDALDVEDIEGLSELLKGKDLKELNTGNNSRQDEIIAWLKEENDAL